MSWNITCYCGHTFTAVENLTACPNCGAVAVLPAVLPVEIAEMVADLQEILDEHGPN